MPPESTVPAPLAPIQGAGWVERPPTVIRTNRGNLKITAKGEIEGLWRLVRRELMTNTETRKLCGFKDRSALAYHRRKDFPAPALRFPGKRPHEYWAKSDVRAWLANREKGSE